MTDIALPATPEGFYLEPGRSYRFIAEARPVTLTTGAIRDALRAAGFDEDLVLWFFNLNDGELPRDWPQAPLDRHAPDAISLQGQGTWRRDAQRFHARAVAGAGEYLRPGEVALARAWIHTDTPRGAVPPAPSPGPAPSPSPPWVPPPAPSSASSSSSGWGKFALVALCGLGGLAAYKHYSGRAEHRRLVAELERKGLA